MATDQTRSIHPIGHGNSVAAWTSVSIIMIGALVGALAIVGGSTPMFIVAGVIILIGVIAWKVLASMGYGEKPKH